MGKKSGRKGSAFEREVAKAFRSELGIELTRTPQSGGWGRYQTKGDLVPGDREAAEKFCWFTECKKEERWSLWSALFGRRGPVTAWWRKAKRQAKSEGKLPVLVMGQNFMEPLALFRAGDVKKPIVPCYIAKDHDGIGVVLSTLRDFLGAVKNS